MLYNIFKSPSAVCLIDKQRATFTYRHILTRLCAYDSLQFFNFFFQKIDRVFLQFFDINKQKITLLIKTIYTT